MLFRKLMAPRLRPLRLWMPMAATVPSRVATRAAATAMSRVFWTAVSKEELPCMFPVSRLEYNCTEKPFQLPRTLLSVNEHTAMNTSGA